LSRSSPLPYTTLFRSVFIVLTFGSAQGSIPLAAAGAGGALVLVGGVGVAVRAPLARVPENAMKFAVGVMLTTFGIFWSAEGAGADRKSTRLNSSHVAI